MKTVSDFLADCGMCPECGEYVYPLVYSTTVDGRFTVTGRCYSDDCDAGWEWTIKIKESGGGKP
jgi:hypothetical protein